MPVFNHQGTSDQDTCPDVLSVVFEGRDRFGQRRTGHTEITDIDQFVDSKQADGWTLLEVISLHTGALIGGIEPHCWSRPPTLEDPATVWDLPFRPVGRVTGLSQLYFQVSALQHNPSPTPERPF